MSTETLVSFEEFLLLPDLEGKRELIEGEVIELPPPKALHNSLADYILTDLKRYFESRGEQSSRVRSEAGFEIRGRVRSWLMPDVSILHPNQLIGDDGYYWGAPLAAIEVVSKSNSARDIDRKRRIYLSNGSQEVWVVYPDTQTITVERAGEAAIMRYQQVLTSQLLPGFSLNLEDLFRG